MSNIITGYNPDVLSCLANLSNDEVFTPPEVANAMLDMLPQELFSDPNTKFLDPGCKSGVFLREIAKRCLEGQLPGYRDAVDEIDRKKRDEVPLTDEEKAFQEHLQKTIDHIFHEQVFGIAITELTSLLSRRSLYCTKYPNSEYSVTRFADQSGNIRYKRIKHRWKDGKCVFCGASEKEYARSEELETHAYELIHTTKPEDVFKMKFDVVISNPPYQLSDGGYRVSASPIYHLFVEKAKKLNPRYLTMIIPARWFAGGKGLDAFRDRMLNDRSIREIHDYPEASDCFSGVQIKGGICYFLWDRDNKGDCTVVTHRGTKVGQPVTRPLLEDGCDVFIRYNEAIEILRKIQKQNEPSFEPLVSARKPFGFDTLFHGAREKAPGDIKVYDNEGIGYIANSRVSKNREWANSWKVFIPEAGSGSDSFPHPILGRPFVGEPGTVSSETYLVIGPFKNEEICKNVVSYIKTKFFRFLVMLKKPSQHATSKVYTFVPLQDFSKPWKDDELYRKYDLTDEEIDFIESMIRPME